MTLLDTDSAQQQGADTQDQQHDQDSRDIPGWLQSIDDRNLQEDATLRRYASPQALAVAHMELRRKLGANPISIPNDKDPPEKWTEFYTKLGRPESAEKYEFKPPEGVQVNEALDKEFRQEAHKLGLSQKQFEGVNAWVSNLAVKMETEKVQEHNRKVDSDESALKKEFGGAFDQNLAIAQASMMKHTLMSPGFRKKLKDAGLDGDADTVRFFLHLGKATMEESELHGLGGGRRSNMKSREQLEEMMKDKRYWSDAEYRKEVERGFQLLYANQ